MQGPQGPVTLRRAKPTDDEALAAFARQIFEETFGPYNTPENLNAYMDTAFDLSRIMFDLIRIRTQYYLVAKHAREVVGYFHLRIPDIAPIPQSSRFADKPAPDFLRDDDPIHLSRFYVGSDWHGTGLAAKMMHACLEIADDLGFKAMYLSVWQENHRAIAFYKKWGFSVVGETTFVMGDDIQNDYWMLRLSSPDANKSG